MKKQKLTKKQRKELALEKYKKVEQQAYEKYKKVQQPAYKKYQEECEKINAEPDEIPDEIPEIIEHNGRKYKLIEESEK